jgi:hypothetical protein
MDLITKYKTKIAELQRKQKTFEAKGLGGACISLQGEIQAYNTVICDLVREEKPSNENGALPIPDVSGSACHYCGKSNFITINRSKMCNTEGCEAAS